MFRTAAQVAAPMLGIAMVVGFIVGVFQSTTMISEPTLSFVPKLIFLVVALIVFGPWMLSLLTEYTRTLWQTLPTLSP
jgi:flagellar biosynthetic protein FliQ